MAFTHENMGVYKKALEFLKLVREISLAIPKGNHDIRDQLTRASTSIVLNIAEGAGRYQGKDKKRFYLFAAGSATECAASLDVLKTFGLITEEQFVIGKDLADYIAAMLVRLASSMDGRTT